jgi:thiamine-phosphate diphosphorylase
MKRIYGLYVIIDPEACQGRPAAEVARLALEGGASVIQWRDKRRDKGEQLDDARRVRDLCHERGAPFIVNDHADLAWALGADGVHVGQRDLPPAIVRAMLPNAIVGVSTNTPEEARAAVATGATYVAVGSVFPTRSKETTRPASPERVHQVREAVHVPVVAIGGIDASNIDLVIAAGADAAAVISAVCGAEDPKEAARALASRFRPR